MWNQAAVYRRRRRTLAASVLVVIVLIIIIIATASGSGGNPPGKAPATTTPTPSTLAQSPAPLRYTTVSSLSEPVRASAATPVPGHDAFSLLGGLDSAGNATSGIGEITSDSTTIG